MTKSEEMMALVDAYAQSWVDMRVVASMSHMEMLDRIQHESRTKLQAIADSLSPT